MAEKLATLEQLKKLALRGKADSAFRIAELATLVSAGLEGAKHVAVTVTLPAANWNGRAQTVRHASLLAKPNYWYFVCSDADCFVAYGEAGVVADNISVNGQATFRCETTPGADLTVNILRLEVDT